MRKAHPGHQKVEQRDQLAEESATFVGFQNFLQVLPRVCQKRSEIRPQWPDAVLFRRISPTGPAEARVEAIKSNPTNRNLPNSSLHDHGNCTNFQTSLKQSFRWEAGDDKPHER